MGKVFPCPHCRTQNFATRSRLRQAKDIPLACWKCGKEVPRPQAPSGKYLRNSRSIKKKRN